MTASYKPTHLDRVASCLSKTRPDEDKAALLFVLSVPGEDTLYTVSVYDIPFEDVSMENLINGIVDTANAMLDSAGEHYSDDVEGVE